MKLITYKIPAWGSISTSAIYIYTRVDNMVPFTLVVWFEAILFLFFCHFVNIGATVETLEPEHAQWIWLVLSSTHTGDEHYTCSCLEHALSMAHCKTVNCSCKIFTGILILLLSGKGFSALNHDWLNYHLLASKWFFIILIKVMQVQVANISTNVRPRYSGYWRISMYKLYYCTKYCLLKWPCDDYGMQLTWY